MPYSWLVLLLLGCAGALGAVARFAVVEVVARRWTGHFPLGTFLINLSGAFVLGLVLTLGAAPATAPIRAILGTGFLGGYTTFSTLSFETQALRRRGHASHAWSNALATLLGGMVAAALGLVVGHAL